MLGFSACLDTVFGLDTEFVYTELKDVFLSHAWIQKRDEFGDYLII